MAFLYAVGGSDGQQPLQTVERYDPRANRWMQVASMTTRRKHLGVAVFNNCIYSVGGRDDTTELSSAECFDPKMNCWLNGYWCFDGSTYLKTVEIFDTDCNCWKSFGSMNSRRLGGGVGVVRLARLHESPMLIGSHDFFGVTAGQQLRLMLIGCQIRLIEAAAGSLLSAGFVGYSIGKDGNKSEFRAGAVANASTSSSQNALLPMPTTQLPSNPNSRAQQILRFGSPTTDSNVKLFDDYVLAYDRRLRIPAWVVERLDNQSRPNPASTSSVVDRAGFEFYEDLAQHPYFRASNSDYAGSGYDRGHMAAAGNHKSSSAACLQTFILSNICPQVGNGFNRHLWNSLERYIRSLTKHYSAVYVCTAPYSCLFNTPVLNENLFNTNNSVAVPTHFFKVVLLETPAQQFELLCYLVPNMAHPVNPEPSLDLFLVPLDAIERAAGFLIFDQVQKSRIVRVNKQ
uniref:Endonuclease n=1 Tax=Macrostomum lignano TaxID=282301 RepID=A0A1I8FEL7_9PLAT